MIRKFRLSSLLFVFFWLGVQQAFGQFTFMVTNLNDTGPGSLREALSFSNNTDTIRFSVTGSITLASPLVINKAITIIGPGSGLLTLNGNNATRIFDINTVGTLRMQGLRIYNATVNPGSGQTTMGGGMKAVVSQFYLKDIVFANNRIGSSASNGQPNTQGGGAHITGQSLNMENVTVNGNTSSGRPTAWGGGLYISCQQVNILNSTISGNQSATDEYVGGSTAYAGGAYINADVINIENSTIQSNSAYAQSGWQTYDAGNTQGGGLYTENSSPSTNRITMRNVILSNNVANSYGNYNYPYGGGWYGKNHNVVIENSEFFSNSLGSYNWYNGSGFGYCTYFTSCASIQIKNSIIRDHAANVLGYDNYVGYLGATGSIAIENVKAYNNDINANYSEGIFFLDGSSGSILASEFYGNNNYSNSSLPAVVSDLSGTLTVTRSSFYGNKRAFKVNTGNLTMVNSTLTTNTDDVYSTNAGTILTMTNCTASGTLTVPTMRFQNTILHAPTLTGTTITSLGGNIINSPSYTANFTQGTDRNNVNPAFGLFDYHGGTTKLYAVQAFSQAINNGVSNGQTRDQRNYVRVGNVDIGSYEHNGLGPSACNSASTQTVASCGNYTWINGLTYTSSNNTATHTLLNAAGCDSVVTLNLTIRQPSSSSITQTACGSFTLNGQTYTNSGTYTQIRTNSTGCDSTITLNLTIRQPSAGVDVHTACGSYTWINGTTYTSSNNTATVTLSNAAGCDSIVTLNLTIRQPSSGVDVHTACGSYTWINGTTYVSNNNTATVTLTNAAGCDSIVTLNLTIRQPSAGVDVHSACGSYTWINGTTYVANNNTATVTLTNAAGCDSIVTLNLTINQPSSGTDVQTACGSFTWINGTTYTANNNSASVTFTNAAGCDSVVTLNLTIQQVNVAITNNSPTLTAAASGATYQWLNCNNGMVPLAGQTGQSFIATVNGSYAVAVTQNGCTDTSACVVVSNVGLESNGFGHGISVFPVPTQGMLTLQHGFSGMVEFSVVDMFGKQLIVGTLEQPTTRIDLSRLPAGPYLIHLNAEGSLYILKGIKE